MKGNSWLATTDHGRGFGLELPPPTGLTLTQSLDLSELLHVDQTD